jgi:hypothetical protein
MKFMTATIGSLLLAALPFAAQAEDISYSYIDLGYNEVNIDNGPTGDGFGLRGSVGIAENFFVFADYSSFDFDGGLDVDLYSVGLGGKISVAEDVDLVGRIGYAEVDASFEGFSGDESGYTVAGGVRSRITEGLELEGNVIYTDLGGGADDTALAVAGRYFFTKNFAIGAEYQVSDDADTIFAGVRFSF